MSLVAESSARVSHDIIPRSLSPPSPALSNPSHKQTRPNPLPAHEIPQTQCIDRAPNPLGVPPAGRMSNPRQTFAPGGKRTAEAAERYTSPASKKPRFDYRNPSTLAPDAPEEDAILELDEIGKGGLQTKRNAVKLDGYESDSSDDAFDARAEAKTDAPPTKSVDEDEMDMFADLDEGTAATGLRDPKAKAKKDVRFMDVEDIEGQVQTSKSGGHVRADFAPGSAKGKAKADDANDESSSDSGSETERDRVDEGEDAEELGAGSKKKHAPKLDAFNVQQEAEEGRFDEAGNYVRKAVDPDSVHDSWLEGLSKKDMKKAREAQEKRDAERRRQTAEDDAVLTSDLLATLITHLHKGETVLEALQRLNAAAPKVQKQKKVPKWKLKKQKSEDMDVDTDVGAQAQDPKEQSRVQAVEAITSAADSLFSRGNTDIYDHERELLMRLYKRDTGEEWVEKDAPRDADLQWEFRWVDARDGGVVHGPYEGTAMVAWRDAGYFGAEAEVEFRQAGTEGWSRSVEFV